MDYKRLYATQICPVCGFQLSFTPWNSPDPKEQCCPCCGIHFGYDDLIESQRGEVYLAWRKRWIEQGKLWWSSSPRPPECDPDKQLAWLEEFERDSTGTN